VDSPDDSADVTSTPVATGTREAPEQAHAAVPEQARASAVPEQAHSSAILDSAEKTRRIPTTRPDARKPPHSNGNVYSSERRSVEASPDATVILPAPHQVRRTTEKRP
jgi:hypothetical protein